jgi:hypothetical protein
MDTNWNGAGGGDQKGDEVDLPSPLRGGSAVASEMVKPDLLSVNVAVDSAVTRRLIGKGWRCSLDAGRDRETRRHSRRDRTRVISDSRSGRKAEGGS